MRNVRLIVVLLIFCGIGRDEASRAEDVTPDKSEQSVPVMLRALQAAEKSLPLLDGALTITDDQTIVILGGTNAMETQRDGYLETLIAGGHPQYQLRFRNLAWQADTVYRQQRPRNFFQDGFDQLNDDRDHRQRVVAHTILLWMGQSESQEGESQLDRFSKAYAELVRQLLKITPRVVLVTPVPFEDPLNIGLDVRGRNNGLASYVASIKRIAQANKLPVVDLFGQLGEPEDRSALTRNGQHLSKQGHWLAARQIAKRFESSMDLTHIKPQWPAGTLSLQEAENLRQRVTEKDNLWMQYYRPTNWAFLYGNRQFVPSSRDHRNLGQRWFPDEVESLVPIIEQAESEIYKSTAELSAQNN
ncbi:MAG: hypothetical protein WBF93_09920 [Pirellulales bacterium]|nr:hypothetical protein [Pirellulales bacterium]